MTILITILFFVGYMLTISLKKMYLRVICGVITLFFMVLFYMIGETSARIAWQSYQTNNYNRPTQVMIYQLKQKVDKKKWEEIQSDLDKIFILWKDVESKKITPKEINEQLGYK